VAALLGALLLHCCLLLVYCCFASACGGMSLRGVAAARGACLLYCFTTALLIYCSALKSSSLSCLSIVLLLLYCFTAVLRSCFTQVP
jgi:hypothetical protein